MSCSEKDKAEFLKYVNNIIIQVALIYCFSENAGKLVLQETGL